MRSTLACLLASLCFSVGARTGKCQAEAASGRDVFGIKMIYATRDGTRIWNSAHWDKKNYVMETRHDRSDPHGISGKRGNGTLTVADGILTMAGEEPRLYINPFEGTTWRDTELTVYYMRVADNAARHAGMVAGVRSGPEGHTTMTPCDAHTYYGRMRHDGAFDFAKELKHPASASHERLPPEQAWPDGKLPFNRWIGWKYVCYNVGMRVKLEVYRDLTEAQDGGNWEKINETVDEGGWFTGTDCPEHNPVDGRSDMRVLNGGTVLIRNTNIQDARYRWVSIREIQSPK
jgi:hypothetical protein